MSTTRLSTLILNAVLLASACTGDGDTQGVSDSSTSVQPNSATGSTSTEAADTAVSSSQNPTTTSGMGTDSSTTSNVTGGEATTSTDAMTVSDDEDTGESGDDPCAICGPDEICVARLVSDACLWDPAIAFVFACETLPQECSDPPSCGDPICVQALCKSDAGCELFDCAPPSGANYDFACGVDWPAG